MALKIDFAGKVVPPVTSTTLPAKSIVSAMRAA
jgi:hypothetical protein